MTDPGFTPCFDLVQVQHGDGEPVAEVVRQLSCPSPKCIGASPPANTWQSTCGICLTDFEAQDDVILLPCYHVLCTACVVSWASSSSSGAHCCPTCRASYG